MRAWIRSERGRPIESLPAWVASVALNLTRSGWRRTAAERRAGQRVRALGEPVAAAPSEDHVEVARALAALPRREREVAVLRYLLGFDTKETAAVLSIGEGTVKSCSRGPGRTSRTRFASAIWRSTMSKVDDELTRRFRWVERPVDVDGLFEGLERRRSHRERVRTVQASALAFAVLAGSVAGFVALRSVFLGDSRTTGNPGPLPSNGEIVFMKDGADARLHLYAARADGSGGSDSSQLGRRTISIPQFHRTVARSRSRTTRMGTAARWSRPCRSPVASSRGKPRPRMVSAIPPGHRTGRRSRTSDTGGSRPRSSSRPSAPTTSVGSPCPSRRRTRRRRTPRGRRTAPGSRSPSVETS